MTLSATICQEQIVKAKKLLKGLPKKDDRQTRREAAKALSVEFKKALKRGYSSKELCALLKKEGIIILAYLIKKFCAEDETITSIMEKNRFNLDRY